MSRFQKTRPRLSGLKKLWEKAHYLHVRITLAVTTEDKKKLSYFLQDEFLAAEDAYNEAADYLQETISSFVKTESPACDPGTDSRSRDETKSSSLKLPRIPILTFSGKFSGWESFRHIFESLVNSNAAMTNISKFHYFKTSVTGDDALLLNRFKISPESYDDMWKMLLTEYNDKRALIHIHLQSFICLQKEKSDTATELKKLTRDTYQCLSVALAALSNLGCQVSSYSYLYYYGETWLKNTSRMESKTRQY
ncbi:hypothetical protein HN011_005507 [Eciton burchellii]|nr:hypothetical protein HN011_005507 [Eciton burchellii]